MRSAVRRWESLHGRACMLQSEILTAVVEGEVQIWVLTADSRASDMERGDVAVPDDGRRGETVSLPGANKRAASRNEPDRTLPLFFATTSDASSPVLVLVVMHCAWTDLSSYSHESCATVACRLTHPFTSPSPHMPALVILPIS
ncbi:hypothetical protein BD310DRAFT_258805 [Dichomitus squalens]|uniref:Uncharacterized protein n=1 Tax=Dichomitus squalens TaxID=114155 RepID=A0A4Q9PH96_9APHY|nr:hypothetical protein BD310DRAFT_258805 [Dichomitus squalens]